MKPTHTSKGFVLWTAIAILLPVAGCAKRLSTSSLSGDTASEGLQILDRMGRPEITNVTMGLDARSSGDTDKYNAEDTFHMSSDGLAIAENRINAGIANLDTLDGQTDWDQDDLAQITGILEEDVLIVDVSKPCDVSQTTYLDIERAEIQGTDYASCGGRTPADDIVDDVLTLSIAHQWDFSPDAPRHMSDLVDQGGGTLSDSFPYLGAPHDVGL